MDYIDKGSYFRGKIENIYPYIKEDISKGICIIGGGISGLITAYYLAKAKNEVVILEKNIIGYGASSFDLGIIDIDLRKISRSKSDDEIKKIKEIYELAKIEFFKIAEKIGYTDIQKSDKIIFTNKIMQKGNIQKEASKNLYNGFECKVVEKISYLNTSNNILFSNKVTCINTFEFCQKLARYLTENLGVKIYENTEVIDIEPSYDNVVCITNNYFKVYCDKLIFCIGNDFLKYEDNLNVELYENYVVVTNKVEELEKKESVISSLNDEDITFRVLNDGRVIAEAEKVKYTMKFADDSYKKSVEKEKFTKIAILLNKIFNVENYIDTFKTYSYVSGKNLDCMPYIDELECMSNCFVNVSFGQNSVLSSILGGQMLTDAVKGLFKKEMRFFRINRENCN